MIEKRERIFPSIAVKMLFLDGAQGLLVNEPVRMLRTYALIAGFKLGQNLSPYLLSYIVGVLIGIFFIIGGWIADSYVGKYGMLMSSVFVYTLCAFPLLGAASIEYTFVDLKNQRTALFIGYATYAVTKLGYGCYIPLISEQFNMPQDKDSLTTYYIYEFWITNLNLMVSKLILPELFNTEFCVQHPCDAFVFFLGIFINCIYLILLMRFKHLFKDVKVKFKSVEKCVAVLYQAICAQIKRTFTNKKSRPKEAWFDLIETEKNREIVADTKTALGIISVILPCFGYYSTVNYLPRLWHVIAYDMDTDFVLFAMQPYQLRGIKYLVLLALLPLSHKMFYPMLRKVGIFYSKMVCIGISFVLIACCLAITSYLQLNTLKYLWQPISENEGLVMMYNTMQIGCNIHSKWTGNFTLKSLQMKQIRKTLTKDWEESVFKMKCGKNPLREHKLAEGNERSFSFVIMNTPDNQTVSVKLPVKNKSRFKPRVYIYCGVWPKCPDGEVEILFSRTTWFQMADIPKPGHMISFDLPEVGTFKLNIAGTNMETDRFRSGGLYSFIILVTPDQNIKVERYELGRPNPEHVAWFAPQILMVATADVLAYVHIEVFVYTQSPTSLRALIFSVLECVKVIGDGMLSFSLKKSSRLLFYQYHLCVFVLSSLCIYIYAIAKYKFRTIHEEEAA